MNAGFHFLRIAGLLIEEFLETCMILYFLKMNPVYFQNPGVISWIRWGPVLDAGIALS